MRIKAFTLVETLVAMVLSSLVIAMGYMGYSLVVKDFNAYSKSNAETSGLLSLENAMNTDFFKATEIHYIENELTVTFDNATEAEYKVENGKVIRTRAGHADSIFVNVTEIKPEIIGPDGLIEKIELVISSHGREFRISFEKEYDAITFIRNDSVMKQRENTWE